MVDLSELKAGDTVVFRGGRTDVAEFIEKLNGETKRPYKIHYYNNGVPETYTKDGYFNSTDCESAMDIVEIIPKEQPTADPVNHPSHYTSGGIECIAAIKASMSAEEYRGYLKGNVMKYLWRYESKEKPTEDLKKARTYLEWLIKEVEE